MIEHQTSENDVLYAEEALDVDVQSFLHRMMIEKAMSRSQLAEAISQAYPHLFHIRRAASHVTVVSFPCTLALMAGIA